MDVTPTADPAGACTQVRPEREQYPLYGRSLALLRTVRPEQAGHEMTSTQVETLRREARK